MQSPERGLDAQLRSEHGEFPGSAACLCDLPCRMRKNTHSIAAAAVETRTLDNNQSHRRSRDALATSRGRRTLARHAGDVVDIGSTFVRLRAPRGSHIEGAGRRTPKGRAWPEPDRPQAVRELCPHFPGLPGAGKDAGPRPGAGRRSRSPSGLSRALSPVRVRAGRCRRGGDARRQRALRSRLER